MTMLGTDAGQCTKAQPCQTIVFALQRVAGTRRTIHVIGGALPPPNATITLDRNVTIDGTNTKLDGPTNSPLFALGATVSAVIEGVSITKTTGPRITVQSGTALRVSQSTLAGQIAVNNGSASVDHSTFDAVRANQDD